MIEWIVTSSILILIILLLRYGLRGKIAARLQYAIWLIVLVRLLLPVSIADSRLSILNYLPEGGHTEISVMGISDYPQQEPLRGEAIGFASKNTKNTEDAASEKDASSEEEPSAKEVAVSGFSENKTAVSASVDENTAIRQEPVRKDSWEIGKMLAVIWLAGIVVCADLFILSNRVFQNRIRSSRKLFCRDVIPVYVSKGLETPCMFGVFHPAVYLTEEVAREEKTQYFVLRHERTHYIHWDHIWAMFRAVCLCLHWYNPLVWIAAEISRQDGELACDESTLAGLTKEERTSYGKSLLSVSMSGSGRNGINSLNLATSLTGGKRQLRERLQFIAKRPKTAAAAVILAACIVILGIGFTFTGKTVSASAGEADRAEMLPEIREEKAIPETELLQTERNVTGGAFDVTSEVPEKTGTAEVWPLDEFWGIYDRQELEERYGSLLEEDLNFDGYEDVMILGNATADGNIPCYCYLWDEQLKKFGYGFCMYNISVDVNNSQVISVRKEASGTVTRYCAYDQYGRLILVREVWEADSGEDIFTKIDLTYVEEEYSIPAFELYDGIYRSETDDVIGRARDALRELYECSGTKVDTCCFTVTAYGNFYFGRTEDDVRSSRTFYDRCYGAEGGFEDCINCIDLVYADQVWYSDVKQMVWPENGWNFTDAEMCTWYLERSALGKGERVKSVEETFPGNFVMEMESGNYYEITYSSKERLVSSVYGPYPSYPQH